MLVQTPLLVGGYVTFIYGQYTYALTRLISLSSDMLRKYITAAGIIDMIFVICYLDCEIAGIETWSDSSGLASRRLIWVFFKSNNPGLLFVL